jgi:predicted RNA binding protein YcfA (HicA-like mRNA interferase family)
LARRRTPGQRKIRTREHVYEPTLSDLRQVLLGLDFQDRSVPGSHVLLEHPPTDTVVLLRLYGENEAIDPVTLRGISRILDEKGVVGRQRLDELLHHRSVAG